MTYVLLVLFLLCSVLLILLILIQKGRGAGLAGAFGGGGGQSAFGTKTADVLTKATAVLTALFFLLALVTGWYLNPQRTASSPVKPPVKKPAESGSQTPGEGQPGEGPAGQGQAVPDAGGGPAPASEKTGEPAAGAAGEGGPAGLTTTGGDDE